jgi:hypothetical protein
MASTGTSHGLGFGNGSLIEYSDGTVEYRPFASLMPAFRVRICDVVGFAVRRVTRDDKKRFDANSFQQVLVVHGSGTTIAEVAVSYGTAEKIESWFRAHSEFGRAPKPDGPRARPLTLVDAQSDARRVIELLGGQVLNLVGTDETSRQALADASERFTAASSQVSQATTTEQALLARKSAVEGLYYVRRARIAMGLDPGPELEPALGEMPIGKATKISRAMGQRPAVVPTTSQSETPNRFIADELMKLAQLRDAGVLTPEEFHAQKAKLLG